MPEACYLLFGPNVADKCRPMGLLESSRDSLSLILKIPWFQRLQVFIMWIESRLQAFLVFETCEP